MPLPNDEKLIALSEEILKQFEAMFGTHPGFRPGHAKGILFETERGQSSLLTQRMSTSPPGKCLVATGRLANLVLVHSARTK